MANWRRRWGTQETRATHQHADVVLGEGLLAVGLVVLQGGAVVVTDVILHGMVYREQERKM